MSLAAIVRAQGQHRGLPPRKLRALLYDATLRAELAEATAEERQQQLDTAGIELSGLRLDLEQERAALETARKEGIRLRSVLDNATSVTVAAGSRDIWPGEEPTHPQGLDVRTLRAQFAARPGSTDPAHIPGRLG